MKVLEIAEKKNRRHLPDNGFGEMHKIQSWWSKPILISKSLGEGAGGGVLKNKVSPAMYRRAFFEKKVGGAIHCTGQLEKKVTAAIHCTAIFFLKETPAMYCRGHFFFQMGGAIHCRGVFFSFLDGIR